MQKECFPGGLEVKNLQANAGDAVRSLGQEDPLEKTMACHSSTFAWRIPMDRGAWHYPCGQKELDTTERLSTHTEGVIIEGHDGGVS